MKTCFAKLVRLCSPLTPLCVQSATLTSVVASTMRQVHLGTNLGSAEASPNAAVLRHTNVASAPRNTAILCALRSESAGAFQQRTTTSLSDENDSSLNWVDAGEFCCCVMQSGSSRQFPNTTIEPHRNAC